MHYLLRYVDIIRKLSLISGLSLLSSFEEGIKSGFPKWNLDLVF